MSKKSKIEKCFWWILFIFSLLATVIYFPDCTINLFKDFRNCEPYLYLKPIIFILSLMLMFVSINKIFKCKWLRKFFHFFRPFYKDCRTKCGKIWRKALIFIIIPSAIFSCFYSYQLLDTNDTFKGYNFFDLLSFMLAYTGLLLMVRVYFEVKEGQSESIDDFLRILTEILDLSDETDEIVIYAPTLFLNEAHRINKTASYKSISYRKKIVEKEKIKLHLLDFNDALNFSHTPVSADNLQKDEEINQDIVCSFMKNNCELILFHKWSLKYEFEDNEREKINEYCDGFFKFMESIKEKIMQPNYILYDNDGQKVVVTSEINAAKGTFAVVNFTKGLFYWGIFDAQNNAEPFFRGTFFKNKHIKKEDLKSLIKVIAQDEETTNEEMSRKNH